MNKNVRLLISALHRAQNNGTTYSDEKVSDEHVFNFEVYKGWPSVKLGLRQDISGRIDRIWLYTNDSERPLLDATVYPEETVTGPYVRATDSLSVTVRSATTLASMAPVIRGLLRPAAELLDKHKDPVNGIQNPDKLSETQVFESFYSKLSQL